MPNAVEGPCVPGDHHKLPYRNPTEGMFLHWITMKLSQAVSFF
jgi:hypothetical protein